ncbi:sugar transporter [Actibacterium lipolyticum]|uniref:Sugar transporter n=1 Tax=Actibacterium lipolyticum TaxID=1524263 RepID=A0A238KU90_9RHOB|nr:sugar transporter [Actibacterium lipolyticum]SMX46413.1 hypothetical protein COL8621_03104 [Actibacterium lipolyticum]
MQVTALKIPAADPSVVIAEPAEPARVRTRHIAVVASFALLVLLPALAAGGYLFGYAKDQYASYIGFSVQKEEGGSAVELLGGFTDFANVGTSDADILFDFMQSQDMVQRLQSRLDLPQMFSQTGDPVFSVGPDPSMEELVRHWRRAVKVYHDPGSGLINLRVLAFAPHDAQTIAQAVFDESSAMINALSTAARNDTMRLARDDMMRAESRLKSARRAVTDFRKRTQIFDPREDAQGQLGLLSNLQAQQANALIELDLLRQTTRPNDPRLAQLERRVGVIETRIDAERDRFSRVDKDVALAGLLSEYEALTVDLEFAEKSYLATLAAVEAAGAEARRQSRYLAAHIGPTLAQTAEHPHRLVWLGVFSGLCLMGWSILTLTYFSLRDRQ